MRTYYVFNSEKYPLIAAALGGRQGQGSFDFTNNQKVSVITEIPRSNVDPTPVVLYRSVITLETDFAEEDAAIRQAAEAEAEIFSTDSEVITAYYQQEDVLSEA